MSTSPIPIRRPSAPTSPSTPHTTPLRRNNTQADLPSSPIHAERITPSRRSSALGASGAEQRRARRQELRNFYGLRKEDGVVGIPVTEEGVVGNPLDIDSPAFNPSLYYDDLISKSSLSGLMKSASSLSADIGNLHSARHALVYNHHHQLFAAGDTISHLNSRTPQLLSIVTNLQQSFSEISRLVDAVALPDKKDESASEDAGNEEGKIQRGMERLRLLVLAEVPPHEIRECYEGFRVTLEKGVEGGSSAMRGILEDCRRLLEELPTAAEPGDHPETG